MLLKCYLNLCCALAGPWVCNNTGQALNDGVHIEFTYLVRDNLFSVNQSDEPVTNLSKMLLFKYLIDNTNRFQYLFTPAKVKELHG